MVKRGTGPRSLMEGSKGGQEPGGGLAMYVSCPLKVGPSSGEPCPPFYRLRGSRGYRWEKEENTKGIEGPSKDSGLPFSQRMSCITWQTVSEVLCSLIFVGHALASCSKWVRPIPPLRAACWTGLLNPDPVGSGCRGDCSFCHCRRQESLLGA